MPSQHVLTQEEWVAAMAKRAMDRIRSELYLDLRYMNAALGALVPTPAAGLHNLATDGAALCYDPEWFIGLYRSNRRYLPRAVLHSVLHCVFRHPWLRGGRDASLWGLACDIAVEQTIDALQVPSLTRPVGWLRQKTYQALRKNGAMPAAGPIYRWLAAQEPDELQKLHREFVCDSHRLWPKDPTSQQAQVQGRRWEQLGREPRISRQQAGQQAGQAAGAETMQAQIEAAYSRRLYKDFLRRFAVMREEPRLDPDEFDLGYYSYGLRTYGNLIPREQLEAYTELMHHPERIDDFCKSDDDFHELLMSTLPNKYLRSGYDRITGLNTRFRIMTGKVSMINQDQTCEEHLEILNAALSDNWNTAADALQHHLELARDKAEGVIKVIRLW